MGALNFATVYGCNVTYIRRSGINLSPTPDLKIKFGDKLVVVGEQENVKEIGMLLGNDVKKLSVPTSSQSRWVLFWEFLLDSFSLPFLIRFLFIGTYRRCANCSFIAE